jgi:putative ABC transport system permease protein
MMSSLSRDARVGLRLLWKTPSFAAVAILTFAIGIAATTVIFSVVYATFFEPLPYRNADRLVMVWSQRHKERLPVSAGEFVEWKRRATAFEDLNAWTWWITGVSIRGTAEQLQVAPATPGFLPMLGYGHPLAVGRDFLDAEGTPGNDQVVIITHRVWRERFGSDPNVLGQPIRIDRKPYTIVGVLAAGPPDENQSQLWVPLSFTANELTEERHRLFVMGRLKPDVTLQLANATLGAVARDAARTLHRAPEEWGATVQPFRNNFLSAETVRGIWLLLAAVGFVLLIACANVANLMLARGTARQRELAIRSSLGATRGEIITQLLTESSLLAIIGGAVGVALAAALLKIVIALMPPDMLPTEAHVRLNVPVLLFALASCEFAGILAGGAPSWQAGRVNVNELLKDAARSVTGSGHRLRRALVATEFALALTLLTGGGLAIHTLFALANRDLGFRTDHLLTFSLPIDDQRFATPVQIAEFYRRVLERVHAVPGVVAASASIGTPLYGGVQIPFAIAGRPQVEPSKQPFAGFNMVTPAYFEAFGMRILRGRAFTDQDRQGAVRVAIVNDTLARQYFPNIDPLTQRLVMPQIIPGQWAPGPPIEWQIVGVRADVRNTDPANDGSPSIDIPFWQSPWPFGRVAVRTAGDPSRMRMDLAAALRSIDPDLPMGDVKTMEQMFSESLVNNRFNSALFGSFALIALLLASFGIYGVMSFVVAQRTQEIGVRMALGAGRSQIIRRVVAEGMITALTGALVGSLGAFYAVKTMRGIITGLTEINPAVLIGVTASLLLSALIACAVPAARAASVDPMIALRRE